MVTCKVDSQSVTVPKMKTVNKPLTSKSSALHLEGDHLETMSSIGKNSIYKLKIDLMFDGTRRSVRSNQLDDPRGSHRTRSIIMYGRSELASSAGETLRSLNKVCNESNDLATKTLSESTQENVQRISNSVQAQIQQLFADVANDVNSFAVKCLGSLPLAEKVTSLQGLQTPLRKLYHGAVDIEKLDWGRLDICATGLRIKTCQNTSDNIYNGSYTTPFHNIAVWSAVKFVISNEDGSAAFLPLITDPDNINKASLFLPLSPTEKKIMNGTHTHSPIFAVVMRSTGTPRRLECHAFICKSTEDAIVIAATLYQSLITHVNSNSYRSSKRRTPRTQNGISCISIASSSAMTGSNYLSQSQFVTNRNQNSVRNSEVSIGSFKSSSRTGRKKRASVESLNTSSKTIDSIAKTTSVERKRRSHKNKRAPPAPPTITNLPSKTGNVDCRNFSHTASVRSSRSLSVMNRKNSSNSTMSCQTSYKSQNMPNVLYKTSQTEDGGSAAALVSAAAIASSNGGSRSDSNGDIFTRVAIPRSGSFLNTGGLTRYKSKAARRHSGKSGTGGGGGSPLGFSELFNEFRLHENLNSLDEILYAIVDVDGMSFNDLKPIYKEFLLKLAVTLTKDELFQRSKNIMRRQRKKKLKQKTMPQQSKRKSFLGTKTVKRIFQMNQFRFCRGRTATSNKSTDRSTKLESQRQTMLFGSPVKAYFQNNQLKNRKRGGETSADVAQAPNENSCHGLNRNSSSGYVSCSECSYDSEACTCSSTNRCYCSLQVTDKPKNRPNNYNERNRLEKRIQNQKNQLLTTSNRQSLISCKSDEKCYCSMIEEERNTNSDDDDLLQTHSDTTWCDTDSCVSVSKCYCTRGRNHGSLVDAVQATEKTKQYRNTWKPLQRTADKLALDYELFTIGGDGKPVKPQEALSVKKSVEAAAIFADVKLSQTTDIKQIDPHFLLENQDRVATNKSGSSNRSRASSKKYTHCRKDRTDVKKNLDRSGSPVSPTAQESCNVANLLGQLSLVDNSALREATKKTALNTNYNTSCENTSKISYQSIRNKNKNISLEDTLGYLP